MRGLILIFALLSLVGCSFKPNNQKLGKHLSEFPLIVETDKLEVLHAKGADFGPQSGFDACYVAKIEEVAFSRLASQVRSTGQKGTSGAYEQNGVCEFVSMRETYDLHPNSDAYNFIGENGTRLDVLINEREHTILMFFWQT